MVTTWQILGFATLILAMVIGTRDIRDTTFVEGNLIGMIRQVKWPFGLYILGGLFSLISIVSLGISRNLLSEMMSTLLLLGTLLVSGGYLFALTIRTMRGQVVTKAVDKATDTAQSAAQKKN